MRILGRVRERLEERRGPVLRRERAIWADTHHLYDVAGRTPQWLAGDLKSQPGYYGPVDVDEDDAPGLTAALIACNRVGLLTENSQAGFDGEGYDGAHWTQLASATGFAHPQVVASLERSLVGTGYGLLTSETATRRWGDRGGIAVTTRAGEPYTTFGRAVTAGDIEGLYDGCGDQAIADICRALQVTVYDPTPGRNTLWDALRRWAES